MADPILVLQNLTWITIQDDAQCCFGFPFKSRDRYFLYPLPSAGFLGVKISEQDYLDLINDVWSVEAVVFDIDTKSTWHIFTYDGVNARSIQVWTDSAKPQELARIPEHQFIGPYIKAGLYPTQQWMPIDTAPKEWSVVMTDCGPAHWRVDLRPGWYLTTGPFSATLLQDSEEGVQRLDPDFWINLPLLPKKA